MSQRTPLRMPISAQEKIDMDKIINTRAVLIHVRKRGLTINDSYYKNIFEYTKHVNMNIKNDDLASGTNYVL